MEYASTYPGHIQILDNEGKRYYIRFEETWNGYQKKSWNYDVWREIKVNNECHVKKVTYEISQKGITTKKIENYILKKDKKSFIQYGTETATAVVEDKDMKITIVYVSTNEDEDKQIVEYLYDLTDIKYDNLISLFSDFIKKFKKVDSIISMKSKIGERICSEIIVDNKEVTSYSFTDKKSETLTCFYTISGSMYMGNFLAKYSK